MPAFRRHVSQSVPRSTGGRETKRMAQASAPIRHSEALDRDGFITYYRRMSLCPSMRTQRTLYRFGALGPGHFGYMVLGADGAVRLYAHPNEHSFTLSGDALRFLNVRGETTNVLHYHEQANVFLSPGDPGLYLLPVLALDSPGGNPSLPPVIINSIPKSGTYFVEAAFSCLGAHPLRLHLCPQECHDYRAVPEPDMHRDVRGLTLSAPAGAVAWLMRPGDVAVGHVDDHAQLDEAVSAGVTVLHAVRDLREVLVSLYHFKRTRVAPVSPADSAWRCLDPQASFVAFLCEFARTDIAHIGRAAEIILNRAEPVLRYEDALRGIIPSDLPEGLGEALLSTRGKPTSTLSDRDGSASPWSAVAEAFFVNSGLAALNESLGYGRQSFDDLRQSVA
jgi:hypothetical protein